MTATVRPFYWSVRRELWENRSVFIAPAVAAGVVLFGYTLGAASFFGHAHVHGNLNRHFEAATGWEYGIAAAVISGAGIITAMAYCLGALHGERRDRSILFWKSLPVSDLTTVAAKITVPMVLVPLATIAIVLAAQLAMGVVSGIALAAHGLSLFDVGLPLGRLDVALVYGLFAFALWYAPIFAWLLFVSGWARRVPFLWAVLPPIALAVIEGIAFHTSNIGHLISHRLGGGMGVGFAEKVRTGGSGDWIPDIDLVGFMTSPDVWGGLVVAGALLAAAVWRRRRAEPI